MANRRFAITLFCLAFGFGVASKLAFGAPAEAAAGNSGGSGSDDVTSNFKTFSSNLLLESDLDEFSIEKGAAISSPFGVGYMLANLNDKVWNMSNEGIESVLKSPKERIAAHYASLLDRLGKAKMLTHSVLYIRDRNSTVKLPEGSQSLKTEMQFADFITDWKNSWFSMNDMITNQTGGKLNDQLVPKGGWWGGAFYPFTTSAYINTNHLKINFEKSLEPIGKKQFWDGLPVSFYQSEGKFAQKDSANYSAVAIPLADKGKYAVFVLPKGKLVQFIRGDLASLLKDADPTAWQPSKSDMKVQIPALNITLLDQHYKKLETLGINHTFCMPESEIDLGSSAGEPGTTEVRKRGPFFASPIVQAHHIQLGKDFIEFASATGSSVNSEEKLKEDHAPDYDYASLPPADSGPVDAPAAAAAAAAASAIPAGLPYAPMTTGSGDAQNAEVVVPVVLDDKLAKSLEEGKMEIKGVDVTIVDPKTNEKIIAQGSLLDSPPSSTVMASSASSMPQLPPTSDIMMPMSDAEITSASSEVSTVSAEAKIESRADLPTTTQEPLEKDTLRFSQPFFWYLYDKELGPLYYGAIHSLATYKKEYGLETDEDMWLFDAYKTLLWNCP